MTESADLDAFDHRILTVVRRNNLEPARTVAERVGLSESAVLRRLRRMRAIGVIVADIAVIDPTRLKPVIMIHVLVQLHQSNPRAEQAFAQKMQRQPEVVAAWAVTGRTDFLLIVAVASIEEYQQFSDRILVADEDVRMFETLVSLREIVRFDLSRADQCI